MPPNDEPTLGEVIRRLEAISGQLTEVVREIKEDRAQAAATFVRQDVYQAQRIADQAVTADVAGDIRTLRTELDREVTAIKAERSSDTAFRRQVLLGFAIGGIGWLLTIALFIANFVAR